ncbi:MAG: F0F1 ATP synthase subunit epsilon, partial [Aureibaculum sp.]
MLLEIVSPEAVLFKGDVESVAVPGVNGEFQMLNNHAPVVSLLKKGDVKIYGNVQVSEVNKSKFKKGDKGLTLL